MAYFVVPTGRLEGSPEEIERQWFDRVYRGRGDSMAQLTWRAVLMGTVLGSILSLTNLYIGLKAGWSFGVAITACVLSYTLWTTLVKLGLARTPMTILENNCMQSTASAAGYSTGATLVSALPAYILINQQSLPIPILLGWVFFIAVLGVTMAIPMKRQMINLEQLPFPSGTAAAVTLQALHSREGGGARTARALGIAGVLAGLSKFWAEGLPLISDRLKPWSIDSILAWWNEKLLGPAWLGRTVFFYWDPIFLAAGALCGLRVGASMLVGGTLCWAVFVPILQHHQIIRGSGFGPIVSWTVWAGAACMVTSSLTALLLQWRSAVQAFRGFGVMLGWNRTSEADEQRRAIEAPAGWFVLGQVVGLTGLAWLGHITFQMPIWQTAIAVVLTFALALVACRVTGETDTTPMGAMAKVTQLTFGAVNPGNINVNLMSAGITSGAAMSAADLLVDLKSGYLLGANPRKQFIAQFCGIFSGTLVTVLAFQVLVPNASHLGTDRFPAPAALTWRAVAEALSRGLSVLEPVKVWQIVIGAAVGVALVLLPLWFPRWRKWMPSPAAIGLSWTFHWFYSLLFFLGGLAAYLFERRRPKLSEAFTFPVASGIIAGGSLVGVLLVFWDNLPDLLRQLGRGR